MVAPCRRRDLLQGALHRARHAGHELPYIVSAWARDNGLVQGPWKGTDKSNEITALPKRPAIRMRRP